MPELERLQEQFKDSIQIILVTKDKKEAIQKLKSKVRIVRDTKLPMILGDMILSKYFPYKTEPYHVWINKNGFVNQLTAGANTTQNNIDKYFKNGGIELSLKQEQGDFDPTVPLWLEGNGRQAKHLLTYSFVMNKITGFGGATEGVVIDSASNKITGIRIINESVLEMFRIAVDGWTDPRRPYNRCLLETSHPEKLKQPKNLEEYSAWADSNSYSYWSKVLPSQSTRLFEMMKQDLERFFGLTGSIEKRKMKCLVLVKVDEEDRIRTKGGVQRNTEDVSGENTIIQNSSLKGSLLLGLVVSNRDLSTPILDETNYPGNIDITIHSRLDDILSVKKELRKYGLDLIEEDREIDMLVIRDRK